jgi:hypothetical protein
VKDPLEGMSADQLRDAVLGPTRRDFQDGVGTGVRRTRWCLKCLELVENCGYNGSSNRAATDGCPVGGSPSCTRCLSAERWTRGG